MSNGKTIREAMKAAGDTPKKPNPYKHDVIYDPRGQWAFPGQVTKIPSSNITMSGVPYPVYGEDNLGYGQMMYPGMNYQFPGQYVTEYPMAQKGKQVENRTLWGVGSQFIPGYEAYLDWKNIASGVKTGNKSDMYTGIIGLAAPFSGKALGNTLDYATEKTLGKKTADYNQKKREDIVNMSQHDREKLFLKYGHGGYDAWAKDGFPELAYGGDPSLPAITGHYQEGGDYNMQRALELGYTSDETGHWPSVDSETGMWLKSKKHPTAWMEYMQGQLDPELAEQYTVRVNPEGYFGEDQLQYVPKKPFGGMYTKTHTHMQEGGWLDQYQTRGEVKPIYVTDPNDPRLKAYSDSLNLYRVGEAELKRFYDGDPGQSYGKIKNLQDLNKATKNYSGEIPKNQLYNTNTDLLLNSKGNVSKISSIYNRTGILPTEFWASEGFLNYRFKKPVQPVIYQKPEEVITPDYLPMIQTGMPDMVSREPEIIASPTSRPSSTNNRIAWRMDPETRKMVPVYLEGKTQKVKEGKRLYNKNIPSSTAAIPADFVPQFEPDSNNDVVSKQMGGWLDQYQPGGTKVYTDKAAYKKAKKAYEDSLNLYKKHSPKEIESMFNAIQNNYFKSKFIGWYEGKKNIQEVLQNPYNKAEKLEYLKRFPNEISSKIAPVSGSHIIIDKKENPNIWKGQEDIVQYKKPSVKPVYEEPEIKDQYIYQEPVKEVEQKKEEVKPAPEKKYAKRNWEFTPYSKVLIYKDAGGKEIGRETYSYDDKLISKEGEFKEGGWLDTYDDEYKRGGSYTPHNLKKKSRKYGTSKNIQSSINKIFARNYDLFGSSGKGFYDPKSKYKEGGGWLDTYQNAGTTGVRKPYILSQQELAAAQAESEFKKLPKKEQIAYYNQLAAANKEPDMLRATEKQGIASKAWEVLMNPFTAATNLYQHKYLPDNFSQGPTNALDIAPQMVNPAYYAESIYNIGKAAVNPQTYKDLVTTGKAAAMYALDQPLTDEEKIAALNTLGTVVDASFARGAGKTAKKAINKQLNKTLNNVRQGMAEKFSSASKKSMPAGKIEGIGTVKDITNSKYYGPLATPVYEGKYPAQSPSGNVKGDLFDLRNTGYTDVPGFNKQLKDLKTQAEFGKRPVGEEAIWYNTPEWNQARAVKDLNELNKWNMQSGFWGQLDKPIPYKSKQAYESLSPNKYGGQQKGWLDYLD